MCIRDRKEIRETTDWRLWQDILDPIYKKSWDRDHFDLSLIVISKETGRPPYFSQGKEARSVPFNPKKHDKEWVKQLQLIFSTWKARKKWPVTGRSAWFSLPDLPVMAFKLTAVVAGNPGQQRPCRGKGLQGLWRYVHGMNCIIWLWYDTILT